MAGSYNHIITDQGNFVSNEMFAQMIENLGDAYEMAEEMYGMIWWLAYVKHSEMSPVAAVGNARKHYTTGLALAKSIEDKGMCNGG